MNTLRLESQEEEREFPACNMQEVAKRAGVAVSSVSRVLSGHPDVSRQMRRRVLAAAEEMGYEPNFLAQSLRRGATLSVGFVVRDISTPIVAEIVLGAETALHARGYSTLLANSKGLPSLDASHIRLFRQRQVDGLLLSLADETHAPMIDELRLLRVPFVLVDRDLAEPLPSSAVTCDYAGGIREVAEYLIGLGHRRIGLVGGPPDIRAGREPASQLRMSCAAWPGVTALVEVCPFTPEYAETATVRTLDDNDPPTAIIVGGIQLLPGVLRALRSRRLRIPDDLSLVTLDDGPFLELIEPPIAALSREPLTLGQEVAELLLRRLADGEPEQITVAMKFDPRASCAPPKASRR